MPVVNLSEWEAFLSKVSSPHLLQSGTWGEFKREFGWDPMWVVLEQKNGITIGAQILFRPILFGFHVAYIPKGPVKTDNDNVKSSDWDPLWPEIDSICTNRKVVFLKTEPDLLEFPLSHNNVNESTKPITKYLIPEENQNSNGYITIPDGFVNGLQNYQPRRTLIINLNGDEDRILGRMKQKTRYNIRLALKKGVIVRPCTNIELFYDLMKATSSRDTFEIHSLDYYRRVYELFHPRGMGELLLAEFQGEPLATLMVFAYGKRAWYFYGASSEVHRESMPTYLLQWEAMKWARSMGCLEYDLWGVPDEDEDVLEANFTERTDGLWGVYRFKRGFGGHLYRHVKSWDRVYKPSLYSLFRLWYSK